MHRQRRAITIIVCGMLLGAIVTVWRCAGAQVPEQQADTPHVPLDRYANAAGAVGDNIVVVGGTADAGERHQTAQTDILDTRTGTWRRGAAIPTPRDFPACVAIGGGVVVIGGLSDDGAPLSVVETYDVSEDRWLEQTPMPTARSRAGACTIGERVYVAGGIGGVDARDVADLAVLERWDPEADAWERLADMPTGRHGHGVVAFGGEVWVIGGYTAGGMTDSVEIYDPRTDTWREGPSLPEARGFASAAAVGDRIVVINSRSPAAMTSVVYENGSWREGPPAPDDRHRGGVAVVGESIYLLAGQVTEPVGVHPHTLRLDTGDWAWHDVAAATPGE